MNIYIADVKDKDDKRVKIMCDCIEAESKKDAKKIAERYGEVTSIESQETHHRCMCGKIIPRSKDWCGKCHRE